MLYILALPCPRLFAPRNGTIVGCDVQPMYGTQCRFACNEGFVLKRGSSRRTCELSSLETRVYWTGSPPVCISKYLYKLDQVEPGGGGGGGGGVGGLLVHHMSDVQDSKSGWNL